MTLIRSFALVLVALFFWACDEVRTIPATQLLVTVSGDLSSEITSVQAQLFDTTEQTPGQTQVFNKTPPFSFAIVPAPTAPAPSVLVVVTARDASNNVIAVSKAVISFIQGKTIALDLRFTLACRGRTCGQGLTCVASIAGTADCGATPVTGGRELNPVTEPGSEFVDILMGGAAGTGDGGAGLGTPGGPAGAGPSGLEAGTTGIGGTTSMGGTASMGAVAGMGGAGGGAAGGSNDGGLPEAGPPPPDCDATTPCTTGYQCTLGKCVSLCEQTHCDPNATCSLMAAAPVCTCGSGYIAHPDTGGAITCLKDVQCMDLGCDTNASCEVGTDQIRHCVCKPGYTGSGTSCTALSCGPLTITNGTVNTNGGTFGQTATYTCDTGYTKTGGTARKCDVSGWTGTAPTCDPFDCKLPTAPAHGSVTATNGTRYPGGTVRYTCSTGYRLSGANTDTRTCNATGWSGATPTCIGCGDGIVSTELGEECELGLFSDPWACINCKNTNGSYAPCPTSGICSGGMGCHSGGYCTFPACTSDTQCAPTPPGPVTAYCQQGFACTLRGCTLSSQCPTGLVCDTASAFCVRSM
jgi:hypothetical protein